MNNTKFYYRGRWALSAALESLDLDEGDNVLFQAYTCVAVPKGIIGAGMTPVMVDVSPRSLFVDDRTLEKVIVAKNIKCFIIQHTFGFLCPKSLFEICRKHKVKVVEDCAHLFPGFDNVMDSYQGDARIFSLEWGKPIPAGLGGVLEMDKDIIGADTTSVRFMSWVKIELQYLAFRLFYRPSLFFLVKRIFSVLKGSALVEDNGMDEEMIQNDSDDRRYKISPLVKRRYKRMLRAHIESQKDNQARLSSFISQFLEYRHLDKLGLDFGCGVPLRIPVMVNNKAEVLLEAAHKKIPLGDWYDTPIDPLHEEAIDLFRIGSDKLEYSWELSTTVVTIPLDGLQSTELMDKTLKFLEKWSINEY